MILKSLRSAVHGEHGQPISLCLIIVLLALVMSLVVPGFATVGTIYGMVLAMLPLLVLAVGLMFVLLVGAIDLSITSIVALTSVVGASLITRDTGYLSDRAIAIPATFASFLLLGAAIGAVNGMMAAYLRMPPFMATLGIYLLLKGVAVWYTSVHTSSSSIAGLPAGFTSVGRGSVGGVPWALLIACTVIGVAYVVLSRTTLGRWFVAVGAGQAAARVAGIPVRITIVTAFVICGTCAGVASIILTARIETGSPVLASDMLLDVIGAAVIGGVSLYGGVGRISGVVLGVVLLTMVDVGLRLLGVSLFAVLTVKGAVIALAAAIDGIRYKVAGQ